MNTFQFSNVGRASAEECLLDQGTAQIRDV